MASVTKKIVTQEIYTLNLTHDELKAISRAVNNTTHININNGLWDGSVFKTTISASDWADLGMMLHSNSY